jgi:transposase
MDDYTLREAATEIGASYDAVRQLANRYRLGYKREGSRSRYLTQADVQFIRSRIGKRGRSHRMED